MDQQTASTPAQTDNLINLTNSMHTLGHDLMIMVLIIAIFGMALVGYSTFAVTKAKAHR